MRVLVCGSRDWHDRERIVADLARLRTRTRRQREPLIVITGDAPGADQIAGVWAELNATGHQPFRADWEKHGKAAGPIRNQRMLDEGRPDLVLAYRTRLDSRGTNDTIRRAQQAGIETRVVDA